MKRPTILGFDSLSQYSGVSEHFLRVAFNRGDLPFDVVWHRGSIYEFDRNAVDDWVASGGAERLKKWPRSFGGYAFEVPPELSVLAHQLEAALNSISNFQIECLTSGEFPRLVGLRDEDLRQIGYMLQTADELLIKVAVLHQVLSVVGRLSDFERSKLRSLRDSDPDEFHLKLISRYKALEPLLDVCPQHGGDTHNGLEVLGLRGFWHELDAELRERLSRDFNRETFYEWESLMADKRRGAI